MVKGVITAREAKTLLQNKRKEEYDNEDITMDIEDADMSIRYAIEKDLNHCYIICRGAVKKEKLSNYLVEKGYTVTSNLESAYKILLHW